MYINKFLKWVGLKQRLDAKKIGPPYISEGEIWWVSLGENVGVEMNGKSHLFTRPVVIFRKLTHKFYLVIPLTTQIRDGTWYVNFKYKNKEMSACLHQIRTIDYRRFFSKMGELAENDQRKIYESFRKLYL